MSDIVQDANIEAKAVDVRLSSDRREFIKGIAVAGVMGAIAVNAAAEPAAAIQGPAVAPPRRPQAAAPSGSRRDSRFPESFNGSVPASTDILVRYFQALAERKMNGLAETLHFPFVSYEGVNAIRVDSVDKLMLNPPLSMNVTGKGESMIKAGAFDILDSIQLHIYGPNGAGLSLEYSRYDAQGKKLMACHGLYGVTNNDGRWGIEYMSTIFKPADQIGRDDAYNISAVDAAYHANQRDHVAGRRDGDLEQLRQAVGDPFPHGSVNMSAPAAGTKSRLRWSEGDTPDFLKTQDYNQSRFATSAGEGIDRWFNSIETPDARVLYASVDKGHIYAGFTRYAADGTVISTVRYLIAQIYRQGRWYGNDLATTFGTQSYFDHLIDARS